MTVLEIYKALADESRLRLLWLLSKGEFNVGEITAVLALSQPTVSHHLKILQSAGLISQKREGTWAFYSLHNSHNGESAKGILEQFLAVCSQRASGMEETTAKDQQSLDLILEKRRDSSHRFFESVAPHWHELRHQAQGGEGHLAEILQLIPPDLTLLELGCGTGALLEKVLPRPGRTIGVDYSPAMLAEAQRALTTKNLSADLRLGNLEHLPVGDEEIDVAVAYMVLHHVAIPAAALASVRRVLKPKAGRLIIYDLARHQNELMRERFADLWLGFDPEELAEWAKAGGFSSTEWKYVDLEERVFLLICI